LDPGWEKGDPAALLPDHHAERVKELATRDPALSEVYVRWAEVLAGAPDAPSLTIRQSVVIGRERGVITAALAQLPSLPIEQRRTWGAALNSVKLGLEGVAKGRRIEIESGARSGEAIDVTLPGR